MTSMISVKSELDPVYGCLCVTDRWNKNTDATVHLDGSQALEDLESAKVFMKPEVGFSRDAAMRKPSWEYPLVN